METEHKNEFQVPNSRASVKLFVTQCIFLKKLMTFAYLEHQNLNLDTYIIALSKEIQCKSISFCGCQSNKKGKKLISMEE